MDDFFDEEGFEKAATAVCPACRENMPPGAVLCTKCGYHTVQGVRVAGHKTPGVDISMGDIALEKAKQDMASADKLQKDLIAGAGSPTWVLALVLTLLTGFATIGVIAMNMRQRAAASDTVNTFNAVATFLLFAAICCFVVAAAAYVLVIIKAFKKEPKQGWLCTFVPLYILYFGFSNWKLAGKATLVALVIGGIGGGCLAGYFNQI